MKKIVLLSLAIIASASFATLEAKTKKKKEVQTTPVVVPVELHSSSDTLSYVAGMSLTNGLIPFLQKQQGVDTAYMAEFIKGFEEMVNSDDPRLKAYAVGQTIATQVKGQMLASMQKDFTNTPDSVVKSLVYRGFVDALKGDTSICKVDYAEKKFRDMRTANEAAKEEKLYGANRKAGEAFLAENAKKDSVVTLPSGLQYKVLVKGTGAVPTANDEVEVNYEGKLIDGTVFDSSSKHGDKPATFRPSQVIKGWTEALTMMPVGSKWQLFIPQELAYGKRNAGQIKPFSALVFTVELVGIKEKHNDSVMKANDVKGSTKTTKSKKK